MKIELAKNIKALRKSKGMTQEQLAEALGVTVGAVYKWETERSVPEIGLIVELAAFFETSVDALLGYGWENGSMGNAAKKIKAFRQEKNYTEGIRFAESVLQKYPNSFEVVFQSACLYFMAVVTLQGKCAQRAIELYEQAIRLMDQNPYEDVSIFTIQNAIAGCYCYFDMDKAIELLKKNNVEGLNDAKIGLLLSQKEHTAEEALRYLSDSLYNSYARIYEVCIGYANVYGGQGHFSKVEELMLWLLDMGKGLKDPSVINFMDKTNVRIYTILAEVRFLSGDEQGARKYLALAKDSAQRFDAAPEYRTHIGLKFYHSRTDQMSYDDMGETGMAMIENYMASDRTGANLRPVWEEINR